MDIYILGVGMTDLAAGYTSGLPVYEAAEWPGDLFARPIMCALALQSVCILHLRTVRPTVLKSAEVTGFLAAIHWCCASSAS